MTKEFVFIHVPRCGGGSVAEATTGLGGKYDPVNRDTDKNREYFYEGHRNSDLLEGAFSFSFIRNPLDRLISAYHCPWVNKRQYANLEDFIIKFVLSEEDHSFFEWSHVMPFTDPRMKLVDNRGNERVDFIGTQENLQEGFNSVLRILNLPQTNLINKHKSERKESFDYYYNYSTKQMAESFYEEDIKFFKKINDR